MGRYFHENDPVSLRAAAPRNMRYPCSPPTPCCRRWTAAGTRRWPWASPGRAAGCGTAAPLFHLETRDWEAQPDCVPCALSLDRGDLRLLWLDGSGRSEPFDAAFPVLHGKNGEDGTVQGLLELIGAPIIGCGALSSALCMDKDRSHKLAALAGVRVPRGRLFRRGDDAGEIARAAEALGYPLFVKPVRSGSSFGVSRVAAPEHLAAAAEEAFRHDREILLEEAVPGFEVSCAILGSTALTVGAVAEFQVEGGFIDYGEKICRRRDPADLLPRPDPPGEGHRDPGDRQADLPLPGLPGVRPGGPVPDPLGRARLQRGEHHPRLHAPQLLSRYDAGHRPGLPDPGEPAGGTGGGGMRTVCLPREKSRTGPPGAGEPAAPPPARRSCRSHRRGQPPSGHPAGPAGRPAAGRLRPEGGRRGGDRPRLRLAEPGGTAADLGRHPGGERRGLTQKYVALPGCSEHQTGLAIDLGKAADEIDFIRPTSPMTGSAAPSGGRRPPTASSSATSGGRRPLPASPRSPGTSATWARPTPC